MNVEEVDLTGAAETFAVANAPLFLVRKLQADPVVRNISERYPSQEILEALRGSIESKPTTVIEAVRPYALLVALWFKSEIDGLQEAIGIPAPDLNWYAYIGDALMISFSPVQTQSIQMPGRLYSSSVTESSPAPINQIVIVP